MSISTISSKFIPDILDKWVLYKKGEYSIWISGNNTEEKFNYLVEKLVSTKNINKNYIKEVAAYVDKKMHEVQRSVPSSMNASKIAILAAMNISDELFGARRGEYSFKGEVESKIKSLIERIEEITD